MIAASNTCGSPTRAVVRRKCSASISYSRNRTQPSCVRSNRHGWPARSRRRSNTRDTAATMPPMSASCRCCGDSKPASVVLAVTRPGMTSLSAGSTTSPRRVEPRGSGSARLHAPAAQAPKHDDESKQEQAHRIRTASVRAVRRKCQRRRSGGSQMQGPPTPTQDDTSGWPFFLRPCL